MPIISSQQSSSLLIRLVRLAHYVTISQRSVNNSRSSAPAMAVNLKKKRRGEVEPPQSSCW